MHRYLVCVNVMACPIACDVIVSSNRPTCFCFIDELSWLSHLMELLCNRRKRSLFAFLGQSEREDKRLHSLLTKGGKWVCMYVVAVACSRF